MSSKRDGGLFRFECDGGGCRANYESDEEGFTEAWHEARGHGWVLAGGAGAWQHYCPKCKRELGD